MSSLSGAHHFEDLNEKCDQICIEHKCPKDVIIDAEFLTDYVKINCNIASIYERHACAF